MLHQLWNRDISVVTALDSWLKGFRFKTLQEQQKNFLFLGQLLCWLLFWYPLHPCVTAVACNRSWSFFQKCSWQVTAKHPCTYRCGFEWSNTVNWCKIIWCTQNMCQDGSSFMWNQPRNNQIALSVQHFSGSKIMHYKRILSCIQNHTWHEGSEFAQEQVIALYKTINTIH